MDLSYKHEKNYLLRIEYSLLLDPRSNSEYAGVLEQIQMVLVF